MPRACSRSNPSMQSNGTAVPPSSTGQLFAGYASASLQQRRDKRQSLRIRPEHILENAEPPSPLNFSLKSGTSGQTSTSKMSLFNLFSKPKVERTRGYTEKGLDVPHVPPIPASLASVSTPNLVVRVDKNDVDVRAPSVLSGKSTATKSTSNLRARAAAQRAAPKWQKPGPFEPPPLFQAYPQSVKNGILEISTMSTETIQHRTKHRKGPALQVPGVDGHGTGDNMSGEGRRSSALRHIASGSTGHVELPKKIFVLVTSGYLLQYTDNGPSDRLPEKMLHLGKDSAAFACDLLPGKHYVLQVSQTVDENGVIVVNSGSILSKLGIRSSAAKRMASSFILIMPNAEEMKLWMTAIRREIEALGGEKVRPDTAIRLKNTTASDSKIDLKKTPSQSHRYQVKRNPSNVSKVTSPVSSPQPDQTTFPAALKDPPRKSEDETATLDGIEMEADKLHESPSKPLTRSRSPSEATSMASTTFSVEQQQLNKLRTSLSSSTRMSRASQAGTVATTVDVSGPNSLAGSPTASEQTILGSVESKFESGTPVKQYYRMSASHSSLNRRRSAAPLPMTREIPSPPMIGADPSAAQSPIVDESPIDGRRPQLPTPKQNRLSSAYSEPNFHAVSRGHDKHDSKVPTPPIPPPNSEANPARPDSFVGDLPSPTTWSSSRNASRRMSTIQQSPLQTSSSQDSANKEIKQARRISSFSMPLKINPSGPHSSATSENRRRRSQMNGPDTAGDSPTVHTLTAKIDSSKRTSMGPIVSYSNSPNLDGHRRSPSNRLSLFPSPLPAPTGALPQPPVRSSSALGQQTPPQAQGVGQTLRRPNSMQVRSDHAPFLASMRNSTGPATTVPIRGMKPSRSASNVTSLAKPSPPEAFKGLKFDTEPVTAGTDDHSTSDTTAFASLSGITQEDADRLTPLSRALSPAPRASSRNSMRRGVRTRSSLPELDLGLDVVALGPPAPPPSAPLPAPPPMSRSTSPSPASMQNTNVSIESIAGLGISVN